MARIWIGWALFYGSVAVSIGCLILWLIMNRVVQWEERSLEGRFGESYLWCLETKKDVVTRLKLVRDWVKAGNRDPWLSAPYLREEKHGFAIWVGVPAKTGQKPELLAPCLPLHFLIEPNSRGFYRAKMPTVFRDSAAFLALWNVFDTLRDPRLLAQLNQE